MTEPDNMVLVLLREIRENVRSVSQRLHHVEERLDRMEGRLGRLEERLGRTDERLGRMEKRLDAMHLNGTKALKGFIGHRAMVERTMASFQIQSETLEQRVAAVEAAPHT